jgi:hypothetical protein
MHREEADPIAELRVRIEGNGDPLLRVFVGGEIDMSVSDALFDALAGAWTPVLVDDAPQAVLDLYRDLVGSLSDAAHVAAGGRVPRH